MMQKTYVLLEPVTRLLNARTPNMQRSLDAHHVDNMVHDQMHDYRQHSCFSMLQSITIGMIGNERYVLDGQHRLAAYEKLQQLGYPVHDAIVPVVVYSAESKEDLFWYYNRINKHMPIHPFERDGAWEDYGKALCERFQQRFGKYVKTSGGCRCPHVSLQQLKTHLHARNINNKLSATGKTAEDLWECVMKLNQHMNGKQDDQMCPRMQKRLQECEAKAIKYTCEPCYLGAWRRFEWLDIAFYTLEHPEARITLASLSASRKRIPAVVREDVWRKHNTNTCDIGECYVCARSLRFQDMECGHIVAHALGGSNTVDNLMPVCKTCNRDMGIMNLMAYKMMFDTCSGTMDVD